MSRTFERVTRAPVWLRNRALRPAVVLCYHRVTTLARDPHRLAISPAQFDEHLAAIRAVGVPTRFGDLAASIRDGQWIRRAVVVTFDDGYADNLHQALPLLAKHDVPATVFVTSGAIGGTREFWWDALERMLLDAQPLPPALSLTDALGDATACWEVPDAARGTGDAAGHDARRRLLGAMRDRLLEAAPERIPHAIEQLHDTLGVARDARDTHRACTADELRRLASTGLVEIGAHTVTHPRLALLSPEAQRHELADGRRTLQEILGRPVRTVAYPFGRSVDVAATTIAAARDAGFEGGCTLEPGAVWGRVDALRIPRVPVHAMDGDGLARWLRWYALG